MAQSFPDTRPLTQRVISIAESEAKRVMAFVADSSKPLNLSASRLYPTSAEFYSDGFRVGVGLETATIYSVDRREVKDTKRSESGPGATDEEIARMVNKWSKVFKFPSNWKIKRIQTIFEMNGMAEPGSKDRRSDAYVTLDVPNSDNYFGEAVMGLRRNDSELLWMHRNPARVVKKFPIAKADLERIKQKFLKLTYRDAHTGDKYRTYENIIVENAWMADFESYSTTYPDGVVSEIPVYFLRYKHPAGDNYYLQETGESYSDARKKYENGSIKPTLQRFPAWAFTQTGNHNN